MSRRRMALVDLGTGLASWALYQRARAKAGARLAQAPKAPPRWRFHDEAWLAPEAVDLALLFAPRWNPHAAAFFTHPFPARGSLELDLATAGRSAATWSLTVRRFGQGAVAHFGPKDLVNGPVARVAVEPGPYLVDGRYYDPTPEATAPRVGIDDDRAIAEVAVPLASLAAAREALPRYQTLRHRVWAHHAVVLARWADRLPADRAAKVFLPAADPTTRFAFGPVRRGESLVARARVGEGQRAFLAVYDAASFPVWWGALDTPERVVGPAPDHGFWLARVVGPPGEPLGEVAVTRRGVA